MSADNSARTVRQADDGLDAVRALQRVLYRSAKQDPTRKFHALYDKLARSDVMWEAWVTVVHNRGAPGVDGVTIDSIKDGGAESVRQFLDELGGKLKAKTYRPQPLRRVHIPKAGKPDQTRPLGIPTVADRVVMAAAKIVLEPIFEADFHPVSFGFRPKKSAHQALDAVRVAANKGALWVLDADIKACFDTIDHEALMGEVGRRICDRQILKLLRSWLRAGVFEGGVVSDTEAGTPQGSPISPLLANIALDVLDRAWQADGCRLGTLVRYADDFVVLSYRRDRAEAARALAQKALEPLGLSIHPDKTRVVSLSNGRECFDFLGFHHHMVASRKWRGRYYMHTWPSNRAMASIRAKIREATPRGYAGREMKWVVADLNPVLRGWGTYFRSMTSYRKFANVDHYVHQRLAKLASTKHGLSGRNWTTRFGFEWLQSLGVYRLSGNWVARTAHA